MSKNLVFLIDIKKDGKTKKEYQISIDSWRHFTEKYDHELMTLEEPVTDMNYMGIIWQRYFLFDILDANELKFDQICIVDADTIIHPDSPDFFKLTNNKYTLVHDDGNFDWIIRSMENYNKHLFTDQPIFNWYEYSSIFEQNLCWFLNLYLTYLCYYLNFLSYSLILQYLFLLLFY